MSDVAPQRVGLADRARRIVVKIGSSSLTRPDGLPAEDRIAACADDMATLLEEHRDRAMRLLVVSSGAIAWGRKALHRRDPSRTIAESQAVASVGQVHLIDAWRRAFEAHGLPIGQVLLTHHELEHRESYLNAHNTLGVLLAEGVVPVLNENDAVGHDEIRFGDNDHLAALVSVMVEADLLVMLTQPDGLYAIDPSKDPDAERVGVVRPGDETFLKVQIGATSRLGRGGMASKLKAAGIAAHAGVETIICTGAVERPVHRALHDPSAGTFVEAEPVQLEKRRHWMRYGRRARGQLVLDAGASKAVRLRGASVLPVGIREVRGDFHRGDAVTLLGDDGRKLGRGLSAYPSDELRRIAGRRSAEITEILGYRYRDVAVHRDDLVVETR